MVWYILYPSGVIYHNQTCGVACTQRCEEGILALPTDPHLVLTESGDVYQCPIEKELRAMNWGPIQGIDGVRAEQIDALLRDYGFTKGITVDKLRMSESEEAWVYVNVEPRPFGLYEGFGSCKGVLVWSNSD